MPMKSADSNGAELAPDESSSGETSASTRGPRKKFYAPVRVLRFRVKDRHVGLLRRCARDVNLVWNFCNELAQKVLDREGRWMTGYDYWPYLQGSTKGDCALSIPVQTVQEVAEEHARRRRERRKRRLSWRASRGARRSLGWVPFKVRTLVHKEGRVRFAGQWIELFDSYNLKDCSGLELRAGSFSEDSRGRWYLNVAVAAGELVGPQLPKAAPVGVDLGLKEFLATSDGVKVEAQRFYRDLQPALGKAQRARKKGRTRAIHDKIRNRRKDFLHKLSTSLVRQHEHIFVGNVNARGLAKTGMAKSVLDAGWSAFRTMLKYKGAYAGSMVREVSEAFSTQTCSECLIRCGPTGPQALGVRSWVCGGCGAQHDRDVNAARNILRMGQLELALEEVAARSNQTQTQTTAPRRAARPKRKSRCSARVSNENSGALHGVQFAAGHGRPAEGIPHHNA